MNKKIIAIATSLVVSGGVLMGTAYAATTQLSGYDAYKLAIVNTKNLKNETADLKLAVNDGTKNLANVSSNIKVNSTTNAMSQTTTVKSSKGSENFSTFKQAGKSISKSSTSAVYNVKEESNNKNFNKKAEKMNPEVAKSMEVILDTLVGNMKDGVTVTDNADGTKKVTVALNKDQISSNS